MKINVSLLIMMVLLCASLTSCTKAKARTEVKQEILALDAQCPVENENGFTLTKAKIEDENVVFYYTVSYRFVNFEQVSKYKELLKKSQVHTILHDASTAQMMTALINADYGLKMVFKDAVSGFTLTVENSPEELLEAKNHKLTSSELLNLQLELTKANLPMKIDEVTIWTDARMVSNTIEFIYELDDKNIDLSLVKSNVSAMKENIKAVLPQTIKNDPFTRLAVRNGVNIKYVYTSTVHKGEHADIMFTNDELRLMINDYIIDEQ